MRDAARRSRPAAARRRLHQEMFALVDEAHRLGMRDAAHAEGMGAVRLAVEGVVREDPERAQLTEEGGLAELGTIDLGKLADLVVFDSNPLQDIETLTRPDQVWAVISNGNMVAGQAVDDGAPRRETVGPRI